MATRRMRRRARLVRAKRAVREEILQATAKLLGYTERIPTRVALCKPKEALVPEVFWGQRAQYFPARNGYYRPVACSLDNWPADATHGVLP
jgi:hypothetical protein